MVWILSTFFSKELLWPLKKLIVSFLNTKDNWFSCCSFLSWHFNWRSAQQQHCHVDSKRENYKDYELSFGEWGVGTLIITIVAASWWLKEKKLKRIWIKLWEQSQLLQRHGDSRRDGCCQWQVNKSFNPSCDVSKQLVCRWSEICCWYLVAGPWN